MPARYVAFNLNAIMALNLSLSAPPPDEDLLSAYRLRCLGARKRARVLAALCALAVLALPLLPGLESFFEEQGVLVGALCGVVMAVSLLVSFAMSSNLQQLHPATPESCLAVEEALAEPLIAKFVERVQLQERSLTEAEANFLQWQWKVRCKAEQALRAKAAAQRIHGV